MKLRSMRGRWLVMVAAGGVLAGHGYFRIDRSPQAGTKSIATPFMQ
jgi:hypothetical protein